MRVDQLGIDESVSILFPPAALEDGLDLPIPTEIVDGAAEASIDCGAVVTFSYHDAFDDVEWVHSIQSGVDQFPHDRLRDAGVALTNSTGIHGDAIGETVAGGPAWSASGRSAAGSSTG